jgi:ribokinase
MGMTTVFNPSPYNEKITPAVLNAADWLILNETEAMGITGSDSEKEEVLAERLRTKFPDKKIVLTLGERGSRFISSDFSCHQNIFKVHAVDTTAAGDTFTGYFIAGVLRGEEIPEALRIAARASAIAVTRAGAAPSIPWAEEVKNTALN